MKPMMSRLDPRFGIGALGGATFGGIGGAMLGEMGAGMMFLFRGGSGGVGNVLGQYLGGFGEPGFELNLGAVAGASVGGAAFGTLNSLTTATIEASGATLGFGARVTLGLPGALAQGVLTAGGGLGAGAFTFGKPCR